MANQKVLFVFPGQGSQYRGIGSDLATELESVRDTYQEASDILGYDMAKLSFEDPKDEINLTRYTQPVLLTHHLACLRAYRELAPNPLIPYAGAGHSLGEYSALVAANALSFDAALKLVKIRGELMSEFGQGEMSALPIDLNTARVWADKYYCAVGGINLPAQTVVAGAADDLDRLENAFGEQNPRKRFVRLKTEGAFHTYYMVDAAKRFRHNLEQTELTSPDFKVLSNYSGDYHEKNAENIKSHLFFQLFHPVNWIGCLNTALSDGISTFVEFGGGIGKGDTPAEKRPNLESMIKKATRGSEIDITYIPAINIQSITAAAEI